MLTDRVIVVTGAGRGLGRAYACDLAARGARVLVNGIDASAHATADEIVEAGGRAVACVCSVTDAAAVRAMFQLAHTELGPVQGLVNNAGVIRDALPWEETPETVRHLVDVNVVGAMLCGMEAARAMREHGRGGSIVNVSSSASFGRRTVWAYSAAKGAVAALTYAWALSMPEIGVRVNCISPYARTGMSDGGPSSAGQVIDPRWTPERITALIAYLMGDWSQQVNGHFVRFDGDRMTSVARPHLTEHTVTHDSWDVSAVAAAFGDVFIPELAETDPPTPSACSRASSAPSGSA